MNKNIPSNPLSRIIHIISYNFSVPGYAAVWDHFLNMISPIASGVLYLTTVGRQG